jgi:hypothetical protein
VAIWYVLRPFWYIFPVLVLYAKTKLAALPYTLARFDLSTHILKVCLASSRGQGCQMVYFQTKNPKMGKFCRVLPWKMLVYFMAFLNILRQFGIFVGHFDIFSRFGMQHNEKSGNPDRDDTTPPELPEGLFSNQKSQFG